MPGWSPRLILLSAGLGLSACASSRATRISGVGVSRRVDCVPFAAAVAGFGLPGDAWAWWSAAAGRYGRTHQPAVGAVLVFRSIPRMPLGHVAVVARILSPREILVDQANWYPGRITRDQLVVDVSPRNDWRAVRVWYAPAGEMGNSDYPTYGFILPPNPADTATVERRAIRVAGN